MRNTVSRAHNRATAHASTSALAERPEPSRRPSFDTRPLPALTALPPHTTNGLRAGRPARPAPAFSARSAWESAPTRYVPARLPPLSRTAASRVGPPARPPLQTFCEAPTDKQRAIPAGLIMIPAHPAMRYMRIAHRAPRPSQWSVGWVALTLMLALAFGVIHLASPARTGPPADDGLVADAATGIDYATLAPDTTGSSQPRGVWRANVTSIPILGGGGASASNAPAPPAPTAATKPSTAAPARPAPTAAPTHQAAPPAATPIPRSSTPPPSVSPAPFSPWPPSNIWMSVLGHSPYAVTEPANDPYRVAFGQCTWWAQHERPDENLRGMGNARYWAAGARARGYRVGATPAAGATVVLQPGIESAGWAGHVAHVMAVYPGGWFLVSEMNAYGNGGGWGRVSYRYLHIGPGVAFIY